MPYYGRPNLPGWSSLAHTDVAREFSHARDRVRDHLCKARKLKLLYLIRNFENHPGTGQTDRYYWKAQWHRSEAHDILTEIDLNRSILFANFGARAARRFDRHTNLGNPRRWECYKSLDQLTQYWKGLDQCQPMTV